MKINKITIPALFAALFAAMLCTLSCSDNNDDTSSPASSQAVSLEGTMLRGQGSSLIQRARFEGSHRVYLSMNASDTSVISDNDENLYKYDATSSTIKMQVTKIQAPDGSGRLVDYDGYIAYWKSEDFMNSYLTEELDNWYQSQEYTIYFKDWSRIKYVNKINYLPTGKTVTTYAIKIGTDWQTKTTIFDEMPGVSVIRSEYGASEFTDIVTVKVYDADYNELPEYRQTIVGGGIVESKGVDSDDPDTSELIEERKNEFMEMAFALYGPADWQDVKAVFCPLLFSYEKNKTVTEYLVDNDTNELIPYEVQYDYYFTPHYAALENSDFSYSSDDGIKAIFTGFVGEIIVPDSEESLRTLSVDFEEKYIRFGQDEPIAYADYTLNENGDDTTLNLSFREYDGYLSGKTLSLKYVSTPFGMKLTEE
ncbi:hypothetical protein [Treponema sp.]|uniref:hypothetical protein n=1 Tax=Treponema sp. TaxID=166 RepID=UPI0025E70320|nr:hypothetical protein [Treponema sp.]MBR4321159.1 hypothetical protein [Treponema sp.]